MHTGNILKIECDQLIPADLLILHSSDKKGCCYVETKNLDGETNLKIKTIPVLLDSKQPQLLMMVMKYLLQELLNLQIKENHKDLIIL